MAGEFSICSTASRRESCLLREAIVRTTSLESLYPLSRQIPGSVAPLVDDGIHAEHVCRHVSELNDLVLNRLLTMLLEAHGPAPVPFCWLLLGSEGRQEQTFRTDQDNALLYADPGSMAQEQAVQTYFARFCEEAIFHLEQCGYPRCPGDMMASNPDWRMSQSAWLEYFPGMIRIPEPERVLRATILFDFKPGYGATELAKTLRTKLSDLTRGNEIFLRFLARDCLNSPAPLTFFNRFALEKKGEAAGKFDMKTKAMTPFTDLGRIVALMQGDRATNTLDRLRNAMAADLLPQALGEEILAAWDILSRIRLEHQVRCMESGKPADNHILPGELTEQKRRALKNALRVVSRINAHLQDAFHLNQ